MPQSGGVAPIQHTPTLEAAEGRGFMTTTATMSHEQAITTTPMITGTVTYYLSEAGRRASLAQGGNGKKKQSVNVLVTSENLALFNVDQDGAVTAYFFNIELEAPITSEEALRILQKLANERAAEAERDVARQAALEARKAEDEERQRAKMLAKIETIVATDPFSLNAPDSSDFSVNGGKVLIEGRRCFDCTSIPVDHPLYAWIDARDAAVIARSLAFEAETAAGIKRLKKWSLAKGSELLKVLIKKGHAWIELAEREFVSAHAPEGFEVIAYNDFTPRQHPEIEELDALNALNATLKAPLSDAQLRWNTVNCKTNDIGNVIEPEERFATLDVTITCPNGTFQIVSRRFATE